MSLLPLPSLLPPRLLLIPALAALLAGCGDSAPEQKTVIRSADGNAMISVGEGEAGETRVEIQGDNGEQVTMNAGPAAVWPADMPDFARALPGAKVIHTIAANDGGTTSRMVMYETSGMTPDKVVAFYKDAAARAGLKEVSEISAAGNFMFGATDKASGRSLSVQAGTNDGKTSGSVSFSVKPPA